MEANGLARLDDSPAAREGKKDPAAALLSLDWPGLACGAVCSAVRAVRAVLLDAIRHMSGRLHHPLPPPSPMA